MGVEHLIHYLGAENVKQYGREWYRAHCPCHGGHSFCFRAGDTYPVVVKCFGGCEFEEIAAALPPGILDSEDTVGGKPAEITVPVDYQESAWQRWQEGIPVYNSLAHRYLDARGIGCFWESPALRFHRKLWHVETQTRWPALLARMVDADGYFLGIHRTYLSRDGSGKAPIEPNRKTYGPIAGGFIALDDPAWPYDTIVFGEGIETSASGGIKKRLPAYAAGSATNFLGNTLPLFVRHVVILVDNDVPGKIAASRLGRQLEGEGRTVEFYQPDRAGADFNDILLRERNAHV